MKKGISNVQWMLFVIGLIVLVILCFQKFGNAIVFPTIGIVVAIIIPVLITSKPFRNFIKRYLREFTILIFIFDLLLILSIIRIPPQCIRKGKPTGSSDSISVLEKYDPSGIMGDVGDIQVERMIGFHRFIYKTYGRGPHEWDYKYIADSLNPLPAKFAGVMYLNPPNNWGIDPNGGFDLRRLSQRIEWEARCDEVDSVNVEFIIGGVNWIWENAEKVGSPYPCSMPRVSLGIKTLTSEWQHFEYKFSESALPKKYFCSVVGGFAWVISWGSNGIEINENGTKPVQPKTFIIDIRNVFYKK